MTTALGASAGCAGKPATTTSPAPASPVEPSETQPAIEMKLAAELDRRLLAADEANRVWMRVEVAAPELPTMDRPPVNVALVLDTSGSMTGDAIETLREASAAFVDELSDGDRLTVVSFGSKPEIVLEPTVLDEKTRASLATELADLQASGTTDLAGGLGVALDNISRFRTDGGIDRIVLLSDGVPNDPSPVLPLADRASNLGITMTAMGLGLEFDETLLAQIATRSGGRFHFVESPTTMAAVFEEEVLRLDRVVGRQLALNIVPGPGVRVLQIPGRTPGAGQRGGSLVALGDLGDGETREVMVQLEIGPHRDEAPIELTDIVLTFVPAQGSTGPAEQSLYMGATASADAEAVTASAVPAVARKAALLEAADVTVKAVAFARSRQLDQAHALVDEMIESLRRRAKKLDAPELTEEAKRLVALRRTLAEMVPPPVAKVRPKNKTWNGTPRPAPAVGSGRADVLRSHARAMGTLGM